MRSSNRLTPVHAVATLAAVLLLGVAPARACVLDTECDDGLVCNGAETCNTGTGVCEPGTPAADNTPCDTGLGLVCTFIDTCQGGVCTPGGGGDSDGDLLCDAEDNCPAIPNAGQADFDQDEVGNVCDDADNVLQVVNAKLKRDNSAPGKKPRGKIVLKGDFVTDDPADVFDPTSGLVVRVQDALGLDLAVGWLPSECLTNPAGNHKCKSLDKRLKAIFRPLSADPSVIRFRILVKEVSKDVAPGPFAGPITVTITNGPPALTTGVDRVGAIEDCQQKGFGLKCRE